MRPRSIKWWCAILAAVQFGLLAGCDKAGDGEHGTGEEKHGRTDAQGAPAKGVKEGLALSEEEARTAGLKVTTLAARQVPEQIAVTATIQANQDRLAHVAPRVSSRSVKVSANLGDKVKAGQTLAQLDSLELGEAHSAYIKARTEAQLAQRNLQRTEGLYKEQIVPEKDYLRVRAEAEVAQAALRAAGDRLRLLGVDSASLRGDVAVSVFPLRSPFSGTVTEKHAVLGDLAQPDESLFTVADLSVLWIEADVFEADLAKLRVGATASVTVNAYPGETFPGQVRYIATALNRETRTVRARIEVQNADGRLKPEMFASAAIDTSGSREVLTVPDEALVLLQGQPTVFVRKGGAFEPRPVQTGDKLRGKTVIKSGVAPGEQAVVAGAYALKAKLLKSQIGDAH
jgi:cobalt-zinc-cadmium efflux system membrane fusion protein